MSLQKALENRLISLLSFKRNSKSFLIIFLLIYSISFNLSKAGNNNKEFEKIEQTDVSYLEPKKELEDYIIDTGDKLFINFATVKAFTNTYEVGPEGEIFLPRIEETYVRGVTTLQLANIVYK